MRVTTGARLLEIHYLDEDVLNSYSDVQIISAEGEIVSTNRLALASCSTLLHKLFGEIELSGCLGSESDMVISTNISTESVNMVVDFVTRGLLQVDSSQSRDLSKLDPLILKDMLAFGIELSTLELEIIETDSKEEQQKRARKKKNELAAAAAAAGDQSRYVKLDWDILGAALESIGGLDPNHPTSVEVVSAEGESQQIIIQPGDGTSFLAQLADGETTYIDASQLTAVTGGDVQKRHTVVDASGNYVASSAKMRRILMSSKMAPHKRRIEMEASYSGSPRGRGRPRKSEVYSPDDIPRSRGRPMKIKTEDEKENTMKTIIFERPGGRRPVKRPRRYVGEDEDEEYSDDQGVEGEELLALADSAVDVDEYGEPRAKRKRKLGSLKKARAIKKEANEGPHRWVTCVACGKICKNNYLFKIHQKNFGPYHNNSCALCDEIFHTWEGHIAHLRDKHNGEYKYKCGLCPEIFETEERQRIHRHETHTRKIKDKTACDKCGKVVIDYAAHQENFHGTEEHPCPSCPRVFGHQMALKRHIKDNHRQFPCEHCGNIMKNFKKYRLHILSVHTPDNLKPYQCQICVPSRGFPTKWNLFEHMNKHTNERPFKCRSCPAAFATTSSRCHHEKACSGSKGLRVLK